MIAVIAGVSVVFLVLTTAEAPMVTCDPGPRVQQEVTAYRTLTFGIATALALALGVLACIWSTARRRGRGESARPGVPTVAAVVLPPLLFVVELVDPVNAPALYYFAYAGIAGVGAVPVLALAALVIAVAGERWMSPPQRADRIETATVVIADGLVFFGLPLAVLAAYLQTVDFCLS